MIKDKINRVLVIAVSLVVCTTGYNIRLRHYLVELVYAKNNVSYKAYDWVDKEVKNKTIIEEKNTRVVNNSPSTNKKGIQKPIKESVEHKKRKISNKDSAELKAIRRVYKKYATKELIDNIDWLYNEAKERGMKPTLVFAVQSYESGWGKSSFCVKKKNCFGYGYTDSGKVGNYEGNNYREVTKKILDSYEIRGYGKISAKVMASKGYNSNPKWVQAIEEIERYFNK